jgi:hypothetical protein
MRELERRWSDAFGRELVEAMACLFNECACDRCLTRGAWRKVWP